MPTVVRSTLNDRRAEHVCRPSCGARRPAAVRDATRTRTDSSELLERTVVDGLSVDVIRQLARCDRRKEREAASHEQGVGVRAGVGAPQLLRVGCSSRNHGGLVHRGRAGLCVGVLPPAVERVHGDPEHRRQLVDREQPLAVLGHRSAPPARVRGRRAEAVRPHQKDPALSARSLGFQEIAHSAAGVGSSKATALSAPVTQRQRRNSGDLEER